MQNINLPLRQQPYSKSSTFKSMIDHIAEFWHFFAATNPEWKNLLIRNKYKDIVIESMRHLVINKKVIIYGFIRPLLIA